LEISYLSPCRSEDLHGLKNKNLLIIQDNDFYLVSKGTLSLTKLLAYSLKLNIFNIVEIEYTGPPYKLLNP